MTLYAHVVDGLVRGAPFAPPEGFTLDEVRTPAFAAECVEVPAGVTVTDGMAYDPRTGAFAPPPAPAPGVPALLAYASARQDAVLAGVWSFDVGAEGRPAHVVTTRLDDRGQTAMMKIALWLQLNAGASGTAVLPYNNVDGSPDALAYAEADALVLKAGALDLASYRILNDLHPAITASPPTVTTFAEVDAAFAALAA